MALSFCSVATLNSGIFFANYSLFPKFLAFPLDIELCAPDHCASCFAKYQVTVY